MESVGTRLKEASRELMSYESEVSQPARDAHQKGQMTVDLLNGVLREEKRLRAIVTGLERQLEGGGL